METGSGHDDLGPDLDATVPSGYAQVGACEVLSKPGRFVVFGEPSRPTEFTLDDAGNLHARPACPKK